VRGANQKPALHIASEHYNLTRRVLAIGGHSEQRRALAVERFGPSAPDRLKFLRAEYLRSARECSPEEFRHHLRSAVAEKFPDETVASLTIAAKLEPSL
jgi:hypothetical protein